MNVNFNDFSFLVALDEYGKVLDKKHGKYDVFVNLCDTAKEKNYPDELDYSFIVVDNHCADDTDMIEKSNVIGKYIKNVFLPDYYKNCQYMDSETDTMVDLNKLSFFGHMKFINHIKVLVEGLDYNFAEITYLFSMSPNSKKIKMVSIPIVKFVPKKDREVIYNDMMLRMVS